MQAIACARSSLYVMTPYFLPDERLLNALSLAAMRGVVVHVVMPRRSNHRFVDWAARQNIGSMLKDGVNVWLGPPPFRHTKIMVVDGEWALIGSANWDMRSFRLNFELCMEVYDAAIVADAAAFRVEPPRRTADQQGAESPLAPGPVARCRGAAGDAVSLDAPRLLRTREGRLERRRVEMRAIKGVPQ